jgi:hypothetical protein
MNRRTATLVWAAMLVVPFAFMGVALGAAHDRAPAGLEDPLLWSALAVSAVNVVLARVLPPRLGPARAHDREAVAFTRVVVALALSEAAALAPLVAYILSRDPRLLVVLAAAVLAHAALFPSVRRWSALLPGPDGVAPRREVR